MNANRSKMILGMFVFFRIFLFKMILQPWLINPRLKRTDNKFMYVYYCYSKLSIISRLNQKIIGSILFHSLMDFYKFTIPPVLNNQSFLPPELKIRPRDPYNITGNQNDISCKSI